MRQAAHGFLIFGIAPFVVATVSLYGLIGGFETSQMFVPIYAIGLIIGVTTLGMHGLWLLVRTVRWLAGSFRRLRITTSRRTP